jgi:hypothetical protein
MSWRDRLARKDPADHADTASQAAEPNGTIGTIDNETLSTTARHGGGKEEDRSNHDSSPEVVGASLAISAESANRAETLPPVSELGDAINAVSADGAGAREKIWGEAEEERAAIIEYDGGILRSWVEGFARLHADCPPAGVPLRRWQQFVDDVGHFLDGPFRAVAAALGWEAHDLFGCNRDRPFARIDQAGLLWLLNGDRLFALTENTATIETRTGARQTWRRKPTLPGRVLPWEIAR